MTSSNQAGSRLSESFLRYFDVACAVTAEQKNAVYGIRYNVYCAEFGYEPIENFPDQREHDEFDAASLHALITHRESGLPAGCVRVVTPQGPPDTARLPLEKHCAACLDLDLIQGLQLDRSKVCEISRLAVDATFRRRAREQETRFGGGLGSNLPMAEVRTFPLVAVSCFLAATALTDLTGRTSVFAMMEPFLPRMLKRSGIVFESVGSEIDYHGLRAPYFIKTQSAIDGMRGDLKELYTEIYRLIAPNFPDKNRTEPEGGV